VNTGGDSRGKGAMEHTMNMKDIEQTIETMEGIVSAKIVESEGVINEIHVLSNRSKIPKLLARDIETLLKTRFELDIDHKKISIVTFDMEETERDVPFPSRPLLWSMGWKRGVEGIAVEVEVKLGDRFYRESKNDQKGTVKDRHILIGQAVLCCLNTMVSKTLFTLRGVTVQRFTDFDLALSFVDCRSPRGEAGVLVGTALVREDVFDAVARATMDAVNRTLLFHLEKS